MDVEIAGHGIVTFASTLEMQDYMALAEQVGTTKLVPEQLRIEAGDYVVKLPSKPNLGLVVVGKTFTVDEFLDSERKASSLGDPYDEEYSQVKFRGLMSRNYLFGRWHSRMEPRGSYEDVHRSMLGGAIPQWLFEQLTQMMGGRQ